MDDQMSDDAWSKPLKHSRSRSHLDNVITLEEAAGMETANGPGQLSAPCSPLRAVLHSKKHGRGSVTDAFSPQTPPVKMSLSTDAHGLTSAVGTTFSDDCGGGWSSTEVEDEYTESGYKLLERVCMETPKLVDGLEKPAKRTNVQPARIPTVPEATGVLLHLPARRKSGGGEAGDESKKEGGTSDIETPGPVAGRNSMPGLDLNAADPAIAARNLDELGDEYYNKGEYGRALELYAQAKKAMDKAGVADHGALEDLAAATERTATALAAAKTAILEGLADSEDDACSGEAADVEEDADLCVGTMCTPEPSRAARPLKPPRKEKRSVHLGPVTVLSYRRMAGGGGVPKEGVYPMGLGNELDATQCWEFEYETYEEKVRVKMFGRRELRVNPARNNELKRLQERQRKMKLREDGIDLETKDVEDNNNEVYDIQDSRDQSVHCECIDGCGPGCSCGEDGIPCMVDVLVGADGGTVQHGCPCLGDCRNPEGRSVFDVAAVNEKRALTLDYVAAGVIGSEDNF